MIFLAKASRQAQLEVRKTAVLLSAAKQNFIMKYVNLHHKQTIIIGGK